EAGILVSEKGLVEHLRVSPNVLPRALRILDALFISFSQSPFNLIWPEGSDKKLDLEVLGESFRFRLLEVLQRRKRVRTAAGLRRQKRDWLVRQSKWEFKGTQRLKLVIADINGAGVHYEWSDSKTQPLETCLRDFLLALITAAKELKK